MKTLIVGMNNPHTGRADAALLPYPVNSAGWRLWKMFHDVTGLSRHTFRQGFEFVNLCDDRIFCPLAARRKYDALESAWAGRRAVLCGRAVCGVLNAPSPSYGLQWAVLRGATICQIPHPSGLTREYNDPMVRLAVGLRLEEEYYRA